MKTKTLLTTVAVIFTVIALLHLWRAATQIPVQFGTVSIPLWASWIAVVVAGFLAYSAYNAR